MKVLKARPKSPQLNLLLEPGLVSKLSVPERSKVRLILAQILMQATGLIVEEMSDDRN
jgi:hypothetical protein